MLVLCTLFLLDSFSSSSGTVQHNPCGTVRSTGGIVSRQLTLPYFDAQVALVLTARTAPDRAREIIHDKCRAR